MTRARLPALTTHVERCMGTVFSFRIAADDDNAAEQALADILTWLHAMDALFSTCRPDSQISQLAAATLHRAAAAPEVRHVLDECDRLAEQTGGYFSAYPDGHRLDPSGYVKGWAIQRAADLLAEAGSAVHYVNGGGDVAAAGTPHGQGGWRIGIADPHRPGALLDIVEIAGPIGVATSGLAERGAHIYDPHTGHAVTELAAVTVIAPDLIVADVYATAAVAMGTRRAIGWLGDRPDVSALLVAGDGTTHRVGRWPAAATILPVR